MRSFAPILVAATYWAAMIALFVMAAPAAQKDVDVVVGPIMVLSVDEPAMALDETPEVIS